MKVLTYKELYILLVYCGHTLEDTVDWERFQWSGIINIDSNLSLGQCGIEHPSLFTGHEELRLVTHSALVSCIITVTRECRIVLRTYTTMLTGVRVTAILHRTAAVDDTVVGAWGQHINPLTAQFYVTHTANETSLTTILITSYNSHK